MRYEMIRKDDLLRISTDCHYRLSVGMGMLHDR